MFASGRTSRANHHIFSFKAPAFFQAEMVVFNIRISSFEEDPPDYKRIVIHYSHSFSNSECTDFTFFDFRSIQTCFLLRGCTDKRPPCTNPGSCISGKSGECGKYCPMLTEHDSSQDLAWRCQGGINPYKENIPAGTPCYAQ